MCLRLRLPIRSDRTGGFTLTELAILLTVVALLTGAAAPSLSGLGQARQDVAATRVKTALIYAQEWAIGSNNDTWVAFNVGGDLISVYVEDPGNPGKANRLALADPLTRSAMTLQLGSGGVGLTSASIGSTSEVQFDSEGTPYNADGLKLTSDGTVGITGGDTVRVTRNTGLITID